MGPGSLDSLSRGTQSGTSTFIWLSPILFLPSRYICWLTSPEHNGDWSPDTSGKRSDAAPEASLGVAFLPSFSAQLVIQYINLGQNYMYLLGCGPWTHWQSPFKMITGDVLSSQADIYYRSLFGFYASNSECFHFWFISDATGIEFSACIHPEFILTVLSV